MHHGERHVQKILQMGQKPVASASLAVVVSHSTICIKVLQCDVTTAQIDADS